MIPNRTYLLVAASLASFITPFMISSVNVALPAIGAELGLKANALTWVVTAYMVSSALFLLPMGRFADLKGRYLIFRAGILFFTAMSFASALAPTGAVLITCRLLQGVGGAMIFSTSMAIVTSGFPVGTRGRAMGFLVASVYTGLSLGPLIGGVLTEHWGWRSLFLVQAPFGLIIYAVSLKAGRDETSDLVAESFDLPGALLYALALAAVLGGVTLLPSLRGAGLIAAGSLLMTIFLYRAPRVPHALLRLDRFRGNVVFAFSNIAALLHYSATAGVGFLLSLYLQTVKGLGPRDAGLLLVIQPAAMAIFSPIAGRLSDRIEPRILASVGMTLSAIAIGMLAFLSASTSFPFVAVSLFLLGFGFALFSSPNTNAVMSSVEGPLLGTASAILGTMRLIGHSLSMGLVMLLFTVILGDVRIEAATAAPFLRSMRVALLIFAGLCLAGIFASLARGRLHSGPKAPPKTRLRPGRAVIISAR